ncbi:transcriptional regulator, LacI family [Candidatus Koribacter versatilis Ellin345]|uniref:Transcriptional regulator, LacI family n=1 Tax=Koribacter versatilis (strain Ellin345) TaxID=204669 RepID=Q1IT89_KORVE|nr:substrate-binding domain-containing protein [Candidatus Koribacter versatilis]ABF39911.1 transcriptional regulator, LacI family [Candidatus Koribacter versatilis Ellin345]
MRQRSGIPKIAELAGVSIGTVDRALHERPGINAATRDRILKIAEKIGYKPNLAARSLVTGKRIRIGVCMPREIAYFYDEMWRGIEEESARFIERGVEFVLRPVPELGVGDHEAMRELMAATVEGIIVTPGHPKASTPLINQAERKGIRVVCVSTDAPRSCRSSIVCVEPHLNGAIAGELMARFVPAASKVVVITGMLDTHDHRAKADGFKDGFMRNNRCGEVLDVIEAHESADESFRKTSDLLKNVPDLRGIYVNTVNCLPVCRALHGSGLHGKVQLISTDLFGAMVPFLEDGTIAASMHQRPFRQAQIAVRSLAEHLLHNAPLAPTQNLNPSIVLRSNLHLFREAAMDRLQSVALR